MGRRRKRFLTRHSDNQPFPVPEARQRIQEHFRYKYYVQNPNTANIVREALEVIQNEDNVAGLLLVKDGLRPATIIEPDAIADQDKVRQFLEKYGLHYIRASANPFGDTRRENARQQLGLSDIIFLVGNSPTNVQRLASALVNYNEEDLGRALGYPESAIRFYLQREKIYNQSGGVGALPGESNQERLARLDTVEAQAESVYPTYGGGRRGITFFVSSINDNEAQAIRQRWKDHLSQKYNLVL